MATYVAARPINLGGTVYAAGAAINTTGWDSNVISTYIRLGWIEVTSVPPGYQPSNLGLKAWTFDPILCGASGGFTSTNMVVVRVETVGGLTVSNAYLICNSAGSGVTDLSVAIYNSAGTRLGVANGQQATIATTSLITIPVSATVTEDFCYVGFNSAATGQPTFFAYQPAQSVPMNVTNKRSVFVSGSGTCPTSFTPGSATNQSYMNWVGLS